MNRTQLLPAETAVTASERIRYAIGGIGFPYAVLMYSSVIMYYFTDILGISAAAAGILLLVARVWDGINDPMMGVIVDKTKSRWGKARPYILAGGLILAVFNYLLFTNPGIEGEGGKLAWAYFTYIGFGMSYTVFVMALKVYASRLTKDRDEITKLSSMSFIGTSIASIFAALTLVSFTTKFAGEAGDTARGYSVTALIASGLLVVGTLILTSIKERDFGSVEKAPSYSLWDAIKTLFKNRPFVGFCLASAVVYVGYYLSAGTLMYYCIYNLGNADYYTPLTVVDYGAPIVAALAVPPMVKRFGKKSIIAVAFITMSAAYALRYVTGDRNVVIMVVLTAIAGLAIGFWNVLFTPTSLDCAVYSRFKTGMQMDALFVSAFSLLQKVASGLGGAFLGFLLESVGYVDNAATQTETVLTCLRICCTLAAAVAGIVGLLLFLGLFNIKDKDIEDMNAALLAREAE